MSFHFNPSSSSSSDEDGCSGWESGGQDGREERDEFRSILKDSASSDVGVAAAAGPASPCGEERSDSCASSEEEEEEEEEEEVDWEEGLYEGHEGPVDPTKDIADITIDLNDTIPTDEAAKQKKRRRIAVRKKLHNLPPAVNQLVLDIHRAHLLSLTLHCVYTSSLLHSSSLLHHLAYSILPPHFHHCHHGNVDNVSNVNNIVSDRLIVPSYETVREVVYWFKDWINHVQQRPRTRARRRQGTSSTNYAACHLNQDVDPATRICNNNNNCSRNSSKQAKTHVITRLIDLFHQSSSSSSNQEEDENTQELGKRITNISHFEKSLLFTCIGHSLKWRIRLVTSIPPISRELTVNHPLLRMETQLLLPPPPPQHQLLLVQQQQQQKDDNFGTLNHSMLKYYASAIQIAFANNIEKVDKIVANNNKGKRRHATTTTTTTHTNSSRKEDNGKNNNKKPKNYGAAVNSIEMTRQQDVRDPLQLQQEEENLKRDSSDEELISWVEILCHDKEKDMKKSCLLEMKHKDNNDFCSIKKQRWIHIDPHYELFDKPRDVEFVIPRPFYSESRTRRRRRRRRGTTVSYVLAVEHRSIPVPHPSSSSETGSKIDKNSMDDDACIAHDKENGNNTNIDNTEAHAGRITDVTPRYANHWSLTLRLRGLTGRDIVMSRSSLHTDKWWDDTLYNINQYLNPRQQSIISKYCNNEQRGFGKHEYKSIVALGEGTQEDAIVLLEDEGNTLSAGKRQDVDNDSDDVEQNELEHHASNEVIPSSKVGFNNHPVYAISSVLNVNEVLCPDAASRMCGMFKGEIIYRRNDVSVALPCGHWLYEGRRVRNDEVTKPVKLIKARKKSSPKSFKVLKSYVETSNNDEMLDNDDPIVEDDGMVRLYGRWQTDSWSPPYVSADDVIPVNEYKNIERALMNPGLVHLEERRIAMVAKKLSIPYAPCLLGFEGHGGNRTPQIRGIVVHEHNAELLLEAHAGWEAKALEDEFIKKQSEVYSRWKRLIVGVLTKQRLEEEYGKSK